MRKRQLKKIMKKNMGCNFCKFHGTFGECCFRARQTYHNLETPVYGRYRNSCQDFKFSIFKCLFGWY